MTRASYLKGLYNVVLGVDRNKYTRALNKGVDYGLALTKLLCNDEKNMYSDSQQCKVRLFIAFLYLLFILII
jgi:hypothetical protein